MTLTDLKNLIAIGEGQTLDLKQNINDDLARTINPGGLTGGLAVSDLGKRSAPRNPLLFGILYRMGLVEHVGSGFKRIQDSLQEYGLGNITLDVNEFWFSVTFRRAGNASEDNYESGGNPDYKLGDRLGNELGDHEKEIIRLIFDNNRISTTMIAAAINLSSTSVGNIIKRLKDKGMLQRMGTVRSGYWMVVRK